MSEAMKNLDQSVVEFLAESEEILARVSANISRLETGNFDQDHLDELYRDIHTLKGTSFLFGYQQIGTLSHTLEASLDPIRKKKVKANPEFVDLLYKCIDLLEKLVQNLVDTKKDPELDRKFKQLLPRLAQKSIFQLSGEKPVIRENFVFFDDLKKIMNFAKSGGVVHDTDVETDFNDELDYNLAKVEQKWIESSKKKVQVEDAHHENAGHDSSIRVQVTLLDRLMNLIGEMVLVRNQVLQYSNMNEDLELINLSQRLDIVTSDLQDQVMKTRMQPIGNVISKFQRLVRDLSRDLGKQVDLTIQGKDTELDKTLLEAIKDPLTHIVRNCCDHGIEFQVERINAGKPANGHIFIRSFHEGGQVIVEVSDDGRGLDRKKLVRKAIEKGLLTQEKASSLQDREILGLIFLPGFSTANQVTSVSGRGVGMDVVRTNVEKIGGSVDLESVEGKGTTIRLRIPLTLAIVPAILLRSGRSVYAIPQVKLVELVRVDPEDPDQRSKIKSLQGKPVYELRGKILPLLEVSEVLGQGTSMRSSTETLNIVVLKGEVGHFGLIVDEVLDTADIVVKPLTKFLKSLEVFSAATILGTGEVALIIDPSGIEKVTGLSNVSHKQEGAFSEKGDSSTANFDAQEYLLFKTHSPAPSAIPLCLVSRLEELSPSSVESSGGRKVVQYRNQIMPLVDVNEALGFSKMNLETVSTLPTIVVQKSGKPIGLVVNEIQDVNLIEYPVDESVRDRFGIMGTVIHQQKVITIVDILSIIDRELTGYFGKNEQNAGNGKIDIEGFNKFRILYAEDVAFFRKQVTNLLTANGYEVITAKDGEEAFSILNDPNSPEFSMILSDIEMPRLNGFGLAKKVRANERFSKVPMIALTTRFNKRDIEEGTAAGFNDYLEKLNPEKLLERMRSLLSESEHHEEMRESA